MSNFFTEITSNGWTTVLVAIGLLVAFWMSLYIRDDVKSNRRITNWWSVVGCAAALVFVVFVVVYAYRAPDPVVPSEVYKPVKPPSKNDVGKDKSDGQEH